MNAKPSVLVTGASSGIGRAIAQRLLGRGFTVWGTSRDLGRLDGLPGLRTLCLDLSDPASISGAAEVILEGGGVDVLVNNAGNGWFGPLEHAEDQVLKDQFQVLLFGPMALTRALLPSLRERKGMVINVSSLAARLPVPFMGPYSAAKAALSTLTQIWQLELAGGDVDFVDLQPGDIDTPFNSALCPDRWFGDSRYGTQVEGAWAVTEANCKNGPGSEPVARVVERLILRPRSGEEVAGSFFQSRLAPLAYRLLPRSVLRKLLRAYYRLR